MAYDIDQYLEDPEFEPLVRAVMGVESGGDDSALSPQGARGRMQVMPRTFRDYALPGEDYSDSEAVFRAGVRKLYDDFTHYGRDPARAAAAYIGGRGAIRGDGSIRDDVADALGTTPLEYAQRVVGRLEEGPPPALTRSPIDDIDAEIFGQDFLQQAPQGIDLDAIDAEFFANPPEMAPPAPGGEEVGFFGTLKEGAKSAGRRIGATLDVLQGDAPELQEAARAEADRPMSDSMRAFREQIVREKAAMGDDAGWWENVKALGRAVWDEPRGAMDTLLEQTPNSAVALAGMAAGAKAGAAAGTLFAPGLGTVVGGISGGFLGMFGANFALETGGKALERAQQGGALTDETRTDLLQEGAAKAGVITAVDAATFGATNWIMGTTRRAAESAAFRVMTGAGMDDLAVRAAMKAPTQELAAKTLLDAGLTPEVGMAVREATAAAIAGANTLGQIALRGGAAVGLETTGEGLGEYLGEYAATGNPDKMDALIEAFSSLGQSGGEIAFSATLNRLKGINYQGIAEGASEAQITDTIRASASVDEAIAATEAAVETPLQMPEPPVVQDTAGNEVTGELLQFPDGTVLSRDAAEALYEPEEIAELATPVGQPALAPVLGEEGIPAPGEAAAPVMEEAPAETTLAEPVVPMESTPPEGLGPNQMQQAMIEASAEQGDYDTAQAIDRLAAKPAEMEQGFQEMEAFREQELQQGQQEADQTLRQLGVRRSTPILTEEGEYADEDETPALSEKERIAASRSLKPLNEIRVQVSALDEDGNEATFEDSAENALKDVDDRLDTARRLMECLAK